MKETMVTPKKQLAVIKRDLWPVAHKELVKLKTSKRERKKKCSQAVLNQELILL